MKIRLRGPAGTSTITLSDSATVADLKSEISTVTDLKPFDLKYGYPPQPLELDQFADDLKVADMDIKLIGEQLIVSRRAVEEILQKPLNDPPAPPAPVAKDPPPSFPKATSSQFASSVQPASGPIPPVDPKATSEDPPEIPIPAAQGTLVMRVMPDDNSCLFRALSSALLSDLDSMNELRSIVATQIQAQPDVYSAAVLEKAPTEYCRWIQREDSWGGAIELSILSQHFDVEICSLNVQDLRVDRFNEGRPTRCVLVYSGIHYDVIALSPSEPPYTKADLPAELDIKVFDAADEAMLAGAVELCRELQKRHYYTDTAGFSIVCNKCGWTGKGEKAATQHAKSTGHYDFGEA